MGSLYPYQNLVISSPHSARARLFVDYEEELARLGEYVEMYRKSSRTRLIPQDSLDFVTTVLDHSEALLGLNRSFIPLEPNFTSVYTKTTTSGNPRPTLTAYDLKKFHGFRNQVTDLVVLEGIRDVHAVLINFAENETAEAFAHAAFGIEFGAPYIQTTESINRKDFYVINFLLNDESMKLTTVRETFSFIQRFKEAYGDLPHIWIEQSGELCKIYLDADKINNTAEAYKNGRPHASIATSGFSLIGNFAFHQEGWNQIPETFQHDDSIIATLEHMQLDMLPTYNRLLKEGLELLQDDRSYLPQTEIEYVREKIDSVIWEEILRSFTKNSSGLETIYNLLHSKKQIDESLMKTISEIKHQYDTSLSLVSYLRAQFGHIASRFSSLRSISVGSEYSLAVKDLEKAFAMVPGMPNNVRFIVELDGFSTKTTVQTLPRIIGFHGFLKTIMALYTQLAVRAQVDQTTRYIHVRFSPSVYDNEGFINILMYSKCPENKEEAIQILNDPYKPFTSTKNPLEQALKQIQDTMAHMYKIELFSRGKKNILTETKLRYMFQIGNLTNRKDLSEDNKGIFLELNLPAFGKAEDFKRK